MTHFLVMVVGNDVDEQLAPYDEDADEQYKARVSVYDHMKKQYEEEKAKYETFEGWLKAYGYIDKDSDDYDMFETAQYYTLDENGEVSNVVDYYNPDARWDWYESGGRYSDMIIYKKEPTTVGCAEKKDINFEQMIKNNEEYYSVVWDTVMKTINGRAWKTYKDCNNKREVYVAQDVIADINQNIGIADVSIFHEYSEYFERGDKEAFMREVGGGFYLSGVVYSGEWHSKHDVGIFGSSVNEVKQDEWMTNVKSILDDVSDDTMITFVDCHI